MFQSEEMQDRRLEVVDVDAVATRARTRTRRSRPAVYPALTPPPAIHMVIASIWWLRPTVSRISPIGVRPNSPPQTTSVVSSRPRVFRSLIKCGTRLIDIAANLIEVAGQGLAGNAVVVPVGVVELHEPHAALDQTTGEQAVVGERRLAGLGAVQLQRLGGLRRPGRSAPGRWSASGRRSRRR